MFLEIKTMINNVSGKKEKLINLRRSHLRIRITGKKAVDEA